MVDGGFSDELLFFVNSVKSTYDHLDDIVFIKDLDFRYVYVNPKFEKHSPTIEKREEHRYIGFTDAQLYRKELAEEFHETDQIVKNTLKTINYDTLIKYEDELKYYNMSKNPIYNNDHKLIGILCIARNITPHVTLRKKYEDNYNLINTIIDNVQFPIFVKDLDFKFKMVNDAFAKLHNKSKEDILGKSDFELFDEELAKVFREKDQLVLANDTKEIYMFQDPVNPYDTKFQSSVTINQTLKNSNNEITGLLAVVNTILDIEEVQSFVIQEEKMYSLAKIAGGIAHDLNNILLNVVGLSSYLVENYDDKNLRSTLTTIQDAGLQASNLIKQLLTFARQSDGKFQTLDLDSTIKHVLSLLKAEFVDKIEIQFNSETGTNQVLGDPDQLTQVFLNLIINANEAIKNNGVIKINISRIKFENISTVTSIRPAYPFQSMYAKISIVDDGIGINKTQIGKIFEPYYSTKGEKNSGLGLSIVYSVVSKHNGFIDVIPLNRGTEFDIYLPLSPSIKKEDVEKENGTQVERSSKIQEIGPIMIVDDNEDVLDLIKLYLDKEGIETHRFTKPTEALQFYKKHHEDIKTAILDLKMPIMNGDELLQELYKIDTDIKVIISSGFSGDAEFNTANSQGVVSFLSKPYKRSELLNKLRELNR